MKLLLDTHVWLWFVRGDSALSDTFAAAIRAPENSVAISVASPWEVQIKSSIGKLDLGRPLDAFLDEALLEFDLLDISLRHIRELVALPAHHRDPFDRILIAQARRDGLTVVTADSAFSAYDVDRL